MSRGPMVVIFLCPTHYRASSVKCLMSGAGALHRPVRHKARGGTHSPVEPRVAGQLLWFSVGGGLAGVHQGHATGQHPPEPPSLRPDCHQVPRTAHHSGSHRDLRVVQELRRCHASAAYFTAILAISALTLLVGRQEEHPACKIGFVSCWCGYLSRVRCRLFAYGPADSTAIPKPHHLLPHLNPDWFLPF